MALSHLALILLTVCTAAAGQLLLKIAMSSTKMTTAIAAGTAETAIAAITSGTLLAGAAAYGAGFFLWLVVLSKVPLSLAYPFVGLGFPLTMIVAATFLGEEINIWRIIGTLLIFVGCVFVARST